MSAFSVPFSSIFVKKGFNHRAVDLEKVERLSANIEQYGLLSIYTCVQTYVEGSEVPESKAYQVVDGEFRHRAMLLLQKRNPERFEELVPNDTITINLVEDGNVLSKSDLIDRSVMSNTWRTQLEPHEVYAEIVRRHNAKQDTYEIGQVMNLQQPRVVEYLSFEKVGDKGHEAWAAGRIANSDMVKLAALSKSDQNAWLKELAEGVEAAGGDDKAAKAAKAKARKSLKKDVAEKGAVREYANAGKPSRKTLASYVPHVVLRATDAVDEAEKVFFNAIAAAFQVMNGELEFDKLSPTKSYVTKKAAGEARKLLNEAAEKEQAKAYKAAAKAEKAAAKEKPAKEKPAKKAPKKAPKKAAKKPAKKKSKKAAAE